MTQTLNLYRLQQADTRLAQIEVRLNAIRSLLESDKELLSAIGMAENAHAQLISAEKTLRQTEYEVKNQQVKIEQTESTLYGGLVHNPKELQDLQQEAAALKRYLIKLEDQQLEAMITLDNAQGSEKNASEALEKAQSASDLQNKGLVSERDSLLKEAERLRQEREAALSMVDATSLAHYEQLRADRRGVAVTTMSDGSCDACGTTLPPAQQQMVHHATQIIRCPTCGRILYGK
jgi:predicted  nucleic acid-binding Zn-ribbon protein